MDTSNKVKVVSMTSGRLGITSQEYNFNRTWPDKGSSMMIDKDVLEQLMFDEGVKYMFDHGMLYIEDMDVKKELGLEPEDAVEPVNVIVLKESDMKSLLRDYSFLAFKEKLSKVSREQIRDLAQYAVNNRLVDIDKCNYIRERCDIDVIQTIRLKELNEAK